MDDNSRFKLEIQIVAPNCRGRWYSLEKIVDADFTNFRDLVDEVVDKCPPSFGDVVKLFYSCMDTKANIQVCSNQVLVEMFAKHETSKCCYMTFCYHCPGSEPPDIPVCDVTTTSNSVAAPCTPSMPYPSIAEPSFGTHTHETEQIPNPNPHDEYLGVDREGLYIDIGPENPEPVNPQSQQRDPEPSQSDTCNDSDSDDESSSDDEIIKDSEPPQKPEASYNKMDPPMACHSARRAGACVGETHFWVCDQVLDWLKEDGILGATVLKKKLKETYKVNMTYRKVYLGKQLAMDKIY
ncbi:hypothetical protein PVAP13_5KG053301, partial [Panicum virgatum]